MAIAQEEERLLSQIAERERATARERMFPGKGCKQAFGEQREGVEFVAADRQRENGNVDDAGTQAIEQHRRNFFDHCDMGLRELAREGRELRWQKVRGDRGDHTDGERAGDGVLTLDDVAFGCFELAQDSARARQKCLAEIGEPYRTAEAIKEARAKFVFQLQDLLGERRLRDVRLFGSAAEGASLGHGAKIAELM